MVGMTWQDDATHVNVEAFADGQLELIREDLRTGELWEGADRTLPRPPPELRLRLARLA